MGADSSSDSTTGNPHSTSSFFSSVAGVLFVSADCDCDSVSCLDSGYHDGREGSICRLLFLGAVEETEVSRESVRDFDWRFFLFL